MKRSPQWFAENPTLFDAPPPAKVCRECDPPTSHRGAEHIATKRGKCASAMLFAIGSAGPLTANEAAAECVRLYGGLHETYRKRIKDLDGRIRVAGERVCRITGQSVSVYETIDKTESNEC